MTVFSPIDTDRGMNILLDTDHFSSVPETHGLNIASDRSSELSVTTRGELSAELNPDGAREGSALCCNAGTKQASVGQREL